MVEEAVAVAAAAAREEGARAAAGEEVERLRRRGNSFDDDDVDLCRLSWGALSFEAGRETLVAEREEAGLVDARRTGLASERAGRGRRELVAIHARGKPKKIEFVSYPSYLPRFNFLQTKEFVFLSRVLRATAILSEPNPAAVAESLRSESFSGVVGER